MKYLITCVVMALPVTIVLAVNWLNGGGDESADEPPVPNMRAVSAREVTPSFSRFTGMETGHAEIGVETDRTTEREERSSPLPEKPLLDPIAVFDTLLTLNFSADDGSLLLDRNARAALQAMYDQLGMSADAQRMEALRALLVEALPEESAQQLLGLLQNYAEYRQAEHELRSVQSAASNDHPLANYDQIKTLRRSYLGDEVASGLFSEEETQLPYMVEAMAVARDTSLPAEERAQKLAALQAGFNEAASRMDSPLAEKVLAARVERLRAEGASDAEIFAARNAVVGSAEAQRLTEADQARQGGEPTP